MIATESALSPDHWLREVFACKAVQQGGVLRRKRRDIERDVGMEAFLAEIKRRGFRAVENCGQVVVFCNAAPVRRLV